MYAIGNSSQVSDGAGADPFDEEKRCNAERTSNSWCIQISEL